MNFRLHLDLSSNGPSIRKSQRLKDIEVMTSIKPVISKSQRRFADTVKVTSSKIRKVSIEVTNSSQPLIREVSSDDTSDSSPEEDLKVIIIHPYYPIVTVLN